MMNYYNSLRRDATSTLKKIVQNKGILAMLFVLFSCVNVLAQVTVTSSTGTTPTATYTTLADAITAINDGATHTGTVLCEVTAGHTETAPIGGFAVTATGTLGNTITFMKSGSGANPTFTASPALVAGALNDAIFKIIGSDYITIDGFTMLENAANTTTAAATNNMTEFGVALFYASATDGCQNVSIKNCTIDLTRTYQNTFGIYANSTHSATALTTSATATGATGGNSNLTITGNTITDVNQGISVVGPTAATDHNDGLVIGGASAGLGNTITNYGTTATFSSFANVSGTLNGILVRNTKNYTISYNTVTSSGLNTVGTIRGIFVPAFNNAPTGTFVNSINNNILDIKSGLLTGAISGIVSEGTTSSTTSTISVNNNTFNGLSHTTATASGTLIFIQQVGAYGTVYVSNNNFNSLTSNTTGAVTFLSLGYSMPTATSTQTYNNNVITGGFNKTGAGGSVTGYTSSSSSVAGSVQTATGNNFSGITVTGATTITGWTTLDGGSPTKNVNGNTFANWTGGTSAIIGINFNYGGIGSSVNNNTINNITSAGTITGIAFGSSSSGAAQTISGNTVTNLTSTGVGTALNINGIAIAAHTVTSLNVNNNIVNTFNNASSTGQVIGINAGASATGTTNVYNNEVFGLNASGVTPLIGGIAALGTTGNINLYANKVHTLTASAATTNNGAVTGFVLQGGVNVNCYNNIVGNLTNPLGSAINAIMGIQVQSTNAGSTYKIYNNSVFLNATSTGANFGTTGLFHSANATATIAALDMTNNIIINQSVANGTGLTTAFRRTLASFTNFLAASNRNLLYAGTPSATNVIFSDGTTSFQTIVDYQTAATPRETSSFTREGAFAFETPGSYFISATSSSADFLKPVAAITTLAESGGASFPALFTTDYAGVIRGGNVGYVGTGSNPDLGAFEFNGNTPAPTVVLNSVTPAATTQCTTVPRLVSVTATTASGTITGVVLNYAFNGVAQAPITMTNTSGAVWEGTLPVAVPTNATVTWSVTATNSIPLTANYSGTSFADEPLVGLSASATASNAALCPGGSSVLTGTLSGTTPATYAVPPAVSNPTTDEDLANVTILDGATVILNNTTARNSLVGTIGTATGTAGSYSNFTSFGPYGLTAGTTYNFSLSSIQDVTAYSNSMAIYIDYNRNGVFTDAGEKVYAATATTAGTHTETGSFVVPAGAFNGLTRMRVISNEGLITSPTQALSYGEYEDYAINITSAVIGGGQVPAYTVSWSDGATTVGTGVLTVNPTATTTYTATITTSGCAITPAPTVTVTVNPAPTAPVATASTQCGAQVPTASVSDPNGYTGPIFKWYVDNVTTTALQTGTFNTFQTSITATTTYYVSITNPTTLCESARTAVTVTVTAPQAITLSTAATVASCLGNGTTVVASSANTGYTYSWTASPVSGSGISGTVTGASQTFTPTALGTYTYTVTGTDGVCTATTQVTVTINVVPSAVVASPVTNCTNAISALTATGGSISNFTILTQNFNGATNDWTTTNSSTGGTPANIAWTLASSPFAYPSYGPFSSNDASQFYLSNNDNGGSGSAANTALTSPSFSTVNFTDAKVSFWHYFRSAGTAKVDYSVDGGTTWTTVQTFTTTTGAPTAFVQENIILPAGALNQSNVQVRFKYDTTSWQYFWMLDNVVVSGTQNTSIVWSPTTNLFTDAAATTPYTGTAAATVYYQSATAATANYTATATSAAGCPTATTIAVTTVDCGIPYANLQFPGSATITTCGTATFYAQVYKAGVTEAAGQGAGITAWIGTNASNTDPATWAESSWQLATFNVQVDNNDEYQGTFGPLAAGTYYVASRFVYTPGNYVYGGYTPTGGGIWDGTTNVSSVLTVDAVAAPTASAQSFCNTATVADLAATGTGIQWYAGATGGSALTSATALATTDYYASQTIAGCEGPRTMVAVTVNVTAAPTASAQSFCNSATVADLVATGTGIQWYAAASGGSALTSATALSTTDYYASQTIAGCEGPRTMVAVTVNVTAAPTASAQSFCNSATVADLVATGTGIQWYAAASGGSALTSATALATTNYYASQTIAGCEGPRTMVAVTVNVTAAPTASAQSFCNSGTVADLVATGTGIQWYAAASGGSALTSVTALATTNYYASQTIAGCEGPRTMVAVTVNVTAAPTASAQSFCNSATVADLVATGTGIKWYAAASGGSALTSATALATTNYYASQTIAGCEGPRTMVAVTVNVTAAPTATSPQSINNPGTIANIAVTGTGVIWYPTSADAIAGTNALVSTTPLVDNTTYYATQTIGGCTSTPTAVLVNVVLRNDSFDSASLSYYPNPVADVLNISYTMAISKIEVYNLLGQIVKTTQPNQLTTQVDMSGLPTASYLVQVTSEGKSTIIKIVKR